MSSEEVLVLAIRNEIKKKETIDASINCLRKELKRVRVLSVELERTEKQKLLANEQIFSLPFRLPSKIPLDNSPDLD